MANPNKILIKAARLWDGVNPDVLSQAFLVAENDRITAIGRQTELGLDPSSDLTAGATVYDLDDGTLLPGLINVHTHLTFNTSENLLADYFREKAAGFATLTLRAVGNLQRSLKIGVTTIRDCGTLNEVVFPVREAVNNGVVSGSRIIASGNGITTTGGHCYYFGVEADTAGEVRKAARAQIKAGADFIKIFATGGHVTPGTNPYEAQYTAAEIKEATTEARRLGKKVAAHAHGVDGIRNSVEARVDTIEHCSFMTPTGINYVPQIAESVAEAGIYVVPTLSARFARQLKANPAAGTDPVFARFLAIQDQRSRDIRRLYDLGITLISGSDSGLPGAPFDGFIDDLKLLVEDVRLSPYQALLTATSLAAKGIGLADTGQLAVGKRADLLGVKGDPLTNFDDLAATRLVALNGQVAHWYTSLVERERVLTTSY